MLSKQKILRALTIIKTSGKINSDLIKDFTLEEQELIYKLKEENLIEKSIAFINSLDTERDWKSLNEKVANTKKPVRPLWKSVLKYAAVFVVLLGSIYFIQTKKSPNSIETISSTNSQELISDKAIKLTMGDGNVKVIKEEATAQLIAASGKILGKQTGYKISYKSDSEIEELVYNELEIPYGNKIMTLELSDGTSIYLNAGSKIKYPVKFIPGKKREVFISGEAYLKVAKDVNHPFIANVESVAVEVLGTEFNISSYGEDKEIKTVLVEGSVRMSNTKVLNDKIILKPGEKGAWNRTNYKTSVEVVDVYLYTSWIHGELLFRNSSFDDMALKLERRYNVSIKNNNTELQNKRLYASFNVNIESIEDIIKSLNEILPFEYEISGNDILIN